MGIIGKIILVILLAGWCVNKFMEGYDPEYWETRKIRQELEKMNQRNDSSNK